MRSLASLSLCLLCIKAQEYRQLCESASVVTPPADHAAPTPEHCAKICDEHCSEIGDPEAFAACLNRNMGRGCRFDRWMVDVVEGHQRKVDDGTVELTFPQTDAASEHMHLILPLKQYNHTSSVTIKGGSFDSSHIHGPDGDFLVVKANTPTWIPTEASKGPWKATVTTKGAVFDEGRTGELVIFRNHWGSLKLRYESRHLRGQTVRGKRSWNERVKAAFSKLF